MKSLVFSFFILFVLLSTHARANDPVEVEQAINISGNNPFNPADPLGGHNPGSPLPPPQTGCSTIFHSGLYHCSGSCGVNSFYVNLTQGSSSTQLTDFGQNPPAQFSCNGTAATSTSTFTLSGLGGAHCQFSAAGASAALSCSRPGAASCSDSCQ